MSALTMPLLLTGPAYYQHSNGIEHGKIESFKAKLSEREVSELHRLAEHFLSSNSVTTPVEFSYTWTLSPIEFYDSEEKPVLCETPQVHFTTNSLSFSTIEKGSDDSFFLKTKEVQYSDIFGR